MGAEEQEAPRRRFGCCGSITLIAGLAVVALVGSLVWWIYGTPFDGWTRGDEDQVRTVCMERGGGTERFCDCFVNELQQEGVAFEDLNSENGRRAGAVCGLFLQF